MPSIDGIISGFNTATVINGLVAIQQKQIDRLASRRMDISRQQTAFNGVEARLATLQASMSRLNRVTNGVFDARKATSSDESRLTISASAGAQLGAVNLRVNSLATQHQVASQGFDSATARVTTGAFTIQTGTNQAETFTIDESRSTLQDVADTINAQSRQVSASLIRDAATSQFRLVLTSRTSGTGGEISVTNSLGPDDGGAVRPDFTNQTLQAGGNASVSIGSGAGAITSEYQTNRVDDLIPGATLNLLQADPSRVITVGVQADTDAVTDAVKGFIDDYNSLIGYLNEQTAYSAETGTGGLLLGNRSVAQIRDRLERMVTGSVPGLDGSLRRLSQIGITINDRGLLSLNQSRLERTLAGQDDAIQAADVRRLFGLAGTSSTGGIQFLLGSSRTKAPDAPIQIDITQAATRGTVLANGTLQPSIVIDSANRSFSLSVDGRNSGTLQLNEGTYTPETLANHVREVINGASQLAGRKVDVSLVGGRLQIASQSWGSSSTVGQFSGTALKALGLEAAQQGTGIDVRGNFIVNGQSEPGRGSGRLLSGDPTNAFTADLQVRVTLTEDQVVDGVDGSLTLTRGVTARLDQAIGEMINQTRGVIGTVKSQFEGRIRSVEKSIARVEAITAARREQLVRQFTSLERVLGQMQATANTVGAQLGSIPSVGTRRN